MPRDFRFRPFPCPACGVPRPLLSGPPGTLDYEGAARRVCLKCRRAARSAANKARAKRNAGKPGPMPADDGNRAGRPAPEPMDAATMADRERRIAVMEWRVANGYLPCHPGDARDED